MSKAKETVTAPQRQPSRLFVNRDMMRQPAQAHGTLREWVVSLTLSGASHYQIGNERFIAVKGDVMVIRPGAPQFWQVLADAQGKPGHWHVAYAAFEPPPHMLAWLDFPMSDEGYFLTNVLGAPPVMRRMNATLRKAQRLSTSPLPMRRELTYHALGEALLWLRAGVAQSGEPMDPRVARAVGFMNRHLHAPISLEDVARAAAASRSQLSLVFQEKLGVSPIKYLERLRMDRAREMLKMTTHPVKHIARAVGYEDPKYFVKRFRASAGVTPRGYRRAGV